MTVLLSVWVTVVVIVKLSPSSSLSMTTSIWFSLLLLIVISIGTRSVVCGGESFWQLINAAAVVAIKRVLGISFSNTVIFSSLIWVRNWERFCRSFALCQWLHTLSSKHLSSASGRLTSLGHTAFSLQLTSWLGLSAHTCQLPYISSVMGILHKVSLQSPLNY
tara:strand:- start:126 stop:614 length:489 start_codon:yes stop_codon:yes gene_type:complete